MIHGAPEPPLVGYIENRLYFTGCVNKLSAETKPKGAPEDAANELSGLYRSGGFLLVDKRNGQEHLLVLPQSVLKVACDSARFRRAVRVTGFSASVLGQDGTESHAPGAAFLLEVHQSGIQFLSDSDIPFRPRFDLLTLAQIKRLESLCENATKKRSHSSMERPSRRKFYSVSAKVDSISPIIAAVPSDPFALMELYEENSSSNVPLSAVVVLKGPKALVCHAGIQPGDSISLHQVRKQRWHVPTSFEKKKLRNRAPSHVFVVDSADAIVWKNPDAFENASNTALPFPTLPSTPVPLVSIRGQVTSRHFSHSGKDGLTLQKVEFVSVDLAGHAKCSRPRLLHLMYYPMSPNLLMGLRPGALFQAVNVHSFGEQGLTEMSLLSYSACLRSTVSVLKCCDSVGNIFTPSQSSGSSYNDVGPCGGTTGRSLLHSTEVEASRARKSYLSNQQIPHGSGNIPVAPPTRAPIPKQLTPYAFARIELPDTEQAFRSHLRTSWYDYNKVDDLRKYNPSLPSFDRIAVSLKRPDNGSHRQQKMRRDPYAEFFDHACIDEIPETSLSECDGCTASWCNNSQAEFSKPNVIGLRPIRDLCIGLLRRRIESMLQAMHLKGSEEQLSNEKTLRVGWTGSIHLTNSMLLKEVGRQMCEPGSDVTKEGESFSLVEPIFTAGLVTSEDEGGMNTMSIADGCCQLPASKVCRERQDASVPCSSCQPGDFAVLKIESSIASCLYLGEAPIVKRPATVKEHVTEQTEKVYSKSSVNSKVDEVFLPPLGFDAVAKTKGTPQELKGLTGSCLVLDCEGLLFIASVQLRYTSVKAVDGAPSVRQEVSYPPPKMCLSVQECLSSPRLNSTDVPSGLMSSEKCFSASGLLCRQRYKFSKVRGETYDGCVLTFSQSPVRLKTAEGEHQIIECSAEKPEISTVQSAEVKVPIRVPSTKRKQIHTCVKKLTRTERGLTENQVALACAWWCIADLANSCAVVAGGWDEFNLDPCNSSLNPSYAVQLQIPKSAVSHSEHGYVRIKCNAENLCAFWIQINGDHCNSEHESLQDALGTSNSFHYVGGSKFFPGMLTRRARRRDLHQNQNQKPGNDVHVVGEMLSSPHLTSWGVPCSTLSHLLWKVCGDVRNRTKTEMEPSLVQLVRYARLLSIVFCRAQVECTRCFQPLRGTDTDNVGAEEKSSAKHVQGVVSSVALSKDSNEVGTTGFWHLPLHQPTPQVHPNRKPTREALRRATQYRTRSGLRCPNGCPMEYSVVKWECSGIIDDESGQAKLYAERDAALTLLGKGIDVRVIEDGAWTSDSGIVFFKSAPPKSYLKHAVREAQWLAAELIRKENKSRSKRLRRVVQSDDILKLLTPQARAEYLLQLHCRHSKEPSRKLHMLCRCKPLSDEAHHLNRSQIEMIAADMRDESGASIHEVLSYSLPPLKLNLVDCFAVHSCAVDSCWSTVRNHL